MEQDALKADITSEAFEKLCDEAFDIRNGIDDLKNQQKKLQEELNRKQERIQAHLDLVGKSKHAGRMGTISMKVETYPSVPKDPEKRKQFFEWLKGKGLFEDMITVNSNTLRSFYKAEKTAAEDNPDFSIPGLEPFERISLAFRRSK
jgi:FtsZ-binding cell division protein ZapB